ncbi:hypothetical protein H0X48_02565 [Candidatus Dependentiae bacterium]|nr:hypothetical protein [Candidatus Dependentiae bacterium]
MSQLQTDKYTVAWFKLAEFVARKEKERALGIYRLLTHSLHDQAVAYQLEGDLLFSFADAKALDSYTKAAELYEQQGKYIQALAIYEHFITLNPLEVSYAQKLFFLSCLLDQENKKKRALHLWAQALAHTIVEHNNAGSMLEESLSNLESCNQRELYEYTVLALVEKKYKASDVFIDQALEYIKEADASEIDCFIARLTAINTQAGQHAQEYYSKNFF